MNKVFRICEEIKAGWAARDLIRLWEGIAAEMRRSDADSVYYGGPLDIKQAVANSLGLSALQNTCPACRFFGSCYRCERKLNWTGLCVWPASFESLRRSPCEYPTSVYRKWSITGDVGYAEAVAAKGYQWLREIKQHGM